MNITTDELRATFDRGFTESYPPERRDHTGVLALTVADTPYAIALAKVAAIHIDIRVATVPSKVRSLLGLATLRNVIVPVHDLGVLLGHRTMPRTSRWLAVAVGEVPLAYAFDHLDGQHRIEAPAGGLGSSLDLHGRKRLVIDLEEVGRAS